MLTVVRCLIVDRKIDEQLEVTLDKILHAITSGCIRLEPEYSEEHLEEIVTRNLMTTEEPINIVTLWKECLHQALKVTTGSEALSVIEQRSG